MSQRTGPELVTVIQDERVRPFNINVPQEAIDDLHRRVTATKWPERETVGDFSQGVKLATVKALAVYGRVPAERTDPSGTRSLTESRGTRC